MARPRRSDELGCPAGPMVLDGYVIIGKEDYDSMAIMINRAHTKLNGLRALPSTERGTSHDAYIQVLEWLLGEFPSWEEGT